MKRASGLILYMACLNEVRQDPGGKRRDGEQDILHDTYNHKGVEKTNG